MSPRFFGLLLVFAAIVTVVALRPGSEQPAAAVVQTETATNTPVSTDTPSATPTTPAATSTSTLTSTPTATGTPVPATNPSLNFPTTVCVGLFPFHTGANVTFSWTGPANVSVIFLDLSLFDNDFQDGTFLSVALSPGTTSFTWNGLLPGQPHFWRVTGLGNDGNWVSSNFARFTPCAVQRLLNLQYACTGGGLATVTFRWAPMSSPGFFQFLDLSIFNNDFQFGTFLGAGPLPAGQQAVVWPGILANTVHFFRVNTFTVFGWAASQTGSFVAVC